MLVDVSVMAIFLAIGNVTFRHFDPRLTWTRRLLKVALLLAITAIISHYFGHAGVAIALGLALLPAIYVHAVWLPRNGVNGWTGEPRDKYYALRGWSSTDR